MKRDLEVLISALEKDPAQLASQMNLECDAVLVNQGAVESSYDISTDNGHTVRVFETRERGVGRSRNKALDLADSEIIMFSDDDIVYSTGYKDLVLKVCIGDSRTDRVCIRVLVSYYKNWSYVFLFVHKSP